MRAMDTVADFSRTKVAQSNITKFVVAGASKVNSCMYKYMHTTVSISNESYLVIKYRFTVFLLCSRFLCCADFNKVDTLS